MSDMASVRLEPAPALDLAGLRLTAGAILFGRLEHSREEELGPPRCLHVTVRVEGDDGVDVHATSACPTHAHDVHDPEDTKDERTRWWRGVVQPFHDAHPRPSPVPASRFVTRDFALPLSEAEVGDRGVLTVAVSPEVERPCVLLREPFEIARVAHEFAPRRLPSVLDACGAAYATPFGGTRENTATFGSVEFGVLFIILAVVAASTARWILQNTHGDRIGVTYTLLKWRVKAWITNISRVWLAVTLPPLPAKCPPGVPHGAWAVLKLKREVDAKRLCVIDKDSSFPVREHDEFLFTEDAVWCLKAEVVQGLNLDPNQPVDGRYAMSTNGRDLVAAFLAAPPRQVSGFQWTDHPTPSEWDSENSETCAESTEGSLTGGNSRDTFRTPASHTPTASMDTPSTEIRPGTYRAEARRRAACGFTTSQDTPRSGKTGLGHDSKSDTDREDQFTDEPPFFVSFWGCAPTDVQQLVDDIVLCEFVSSVTALVLPTKKGAPCYAIDPSFDESARCCSKQVRSKHGKKQGRRTSTAFDFRGTSESPMAFASFDSATGQCRRKSAAGQIA